ncbi:MAG: radical SAM family heme chaperone HemW [Acidimicrobiales bacterium]
MAFGVYVHVPFCARRCDYCAFATWTDRDHLMDAYTAACVAEVRGASLAPATSVFFGGGTPSLLPGLTDILDVIDRQPGCEVTVECNPETVTASLFERYQAHGVTRVSLGVQSIVPGVLASLGRHSSGVPEAVALAREHFATWNVDLIYGAAAERDLDWRRTLDTVLAWGPPHLSAYALTVEPGTPLAADRARHPDDDVSAERYLEACAAFDAAGLRNYEISNWARPGHECAHNLLYWAQADYRGIGCAAHSHAAGRRWWNVRTPERYIACVQAGASPLAGEERLDAPTRRREALQLSLRTQAGVPIETLDDIDMLVDADLVERADTRVVLTARGRLLANEVAVRLRPAG